MFGAIGVRKQNRLKPFICCVFFLGACQMPPAENSRQFVEAISPRLIHRLPGDTLTGAIFTERHCALDSLKNSTSECESERSYLETSFRLLCSGQSNMAYTIERAESSGWKRPVNLSERLAAVDIRFVTIARNPKSKPGMPRSLAFERATGSNAHEASALCLLTALEIAEQEDRPVEFVVTAAGGSKIEAWLPLNAADALGLVSKDHWAFLGDPEFYTGAWKDTILETLNATPKPRDFNAIVEVPGHWEDQGYSDLDGLVWLESVFTLTDEQASQPATLNLATIDDWDTTWVNDCQVGSTFSWDAPRQYDVPAHCLEPGRNTLRVRISDFGGLGGIAGEPNDIVLDLTKTGDTIPLSGHWRLAFAGVLPVLPVHPGSDRTTPSLLFNGMVAPLANERFDALIWYQGEENAYAGDTPDDYAAKLNALIETWRETLGLPELEVFLIQLPEFEPGDSVDRFAFGDIRIGQFLAATQNNNVILVSALGLGVPDNIHPPDKAELARRVASARGDLGGVRTNCQLVRLGVPDALNGLLESCDKSIRNCKPEFVDLHSPDALNVLLSTEPTEGSRLSVLGRANVPSHWFKCGAGAVPASVKKPE